MLALRWPDVDEHKDYVRVSKARSKGRLNDCTKNLTIRGLLLNERTLHALEAARSISFHEDGYAFKSPRLGIEFKTEKSPREVFNDQLKQFEIRHRPAYNPRHTCATMLLMSGANINWVASQLGNSPLMVAAVYANGSTAKRTKTKWRN